jgi:anti-sigma-K factor RskA
MMALSEDHMALAAEYALGTLDADERAQAEAMMSVDQDFAAMIGAWQYRLASLNQMVGSVEPRSEVWDNIRAAVGLSGPQAPLALPDAPARPNADAIAPVDASAGTANVVRLSVPARRWRNVAAFASAIAASLVAVIAVGAYRPDLLPERFRPEARTQTVEVKIPQVLPASSQYVGVLQKDGGSPAFILTVDGATRNFTVRRAGVSAEPGKSFELWLISDRLPRPRSLGVIGEADFTERPVLASYDPDVVATATYAVTVEQAGGSPDGVPHSAPVFTGTLIESVPAR